MNDPVSFETQIEKHKPYLDPRLTDFLGDMDLLGWVHNELDPKEEFYIPDQQDALFDGFRQLTDDPRQAVRRAIELVEPIADSVPSSQQVSNVGKLVMRDASEVTDYDESNASQALTWAFTQLASSQNLSAYHRLYDKALNKFDRSAAKPQPQTRQLSSRVTVRHVPVEELPATEPDTESIQSQQGAREPLVIQNRDLPIHETIRARNRPIVFKRRVTNWLESETASGSAKFNDLVTVSADFWGIDRVAAEEILRSVIGISDKLEIRGEEGSNQVGIKRSEAEIAALKQRRAESEAVKEKPNLDIDKDWGKVEVILQKLEETDINTGLKAGQIQKLLRANGYDVEIDECRRIARVIESTGFAVYEQVGGKSNSPSLKWQKPTQRTKYRDDPAAYVENIFEAALFPEDNA